MVECVVKNCKEIRQNEMEKRKIKYGNISYNYLIGYDNCYALNSISIKVDFKKGFQLKYFVFFFFFVCSSIYMFNGCWFFFCLLNSKLIIIIFFVFKFLIIHSVLFISCVVLCMRVIKLLLNVWRQWSSESRINWSVFVG